MVDLALPAAGQTVGCLVDPADLADLLSGHLEGQGSVVRRNHVPAVFQLGHAAAPVRAHAGVHHGDEHRAIGPVSDLILQGGGGTGNIKPGQASGNIALQLRVHTFADANQDGAVTAEIVLLEDTGL